MDAFDYQRQFDDAPEQAFAARDSTVRSAYLDLADFYREKLEERAQMRRAGEIIRSFRERRSAAAA